MIQNYWTQLSIDFANKKNYLDQLFRVYPTIPDISREVDLNLWNQIETTFTSRANTELIKNLLKLDLFPIKDSYVAYLKKDKDSLNRNPETVDRLCGRVYEMGLDSVYKRITEPKETNRQIGPMFRNWYKKGSLGMKITADTQTFLDSNTSIILDQSDEKLKQFANNHLGYNSTKGLDLVCKVNGKYVIAEAKFLTDYGGHQNAQLQDAINVIKTNCNAIKIAILDGVVYITPKHEYRENKMFKLIREESKIGNIMSSLVLREFLYQI